MATTKSHATKQKQQSGQCSAKGGITDKGDAGTGGSGKSNKCPFGCSDPKCKVTLQSFLKSLK
jgi:hypothetical protein